ncbi:MAG: hypothetical protein ACXV2B_09235 [Halobacteriota archaeon]
MRRHEFLSILGGAAIGRPLDARAQQPMPVIGYLFADSSKSSGHLVAAFREGLSEAGYVDGRNLFVNELLHDLTGEADTRSASHLKALEGQNISTRTIAQTIPHPIHVMFG